MSAVETFPRPFVPGTTGWTASDLDDPRIERLWFAGRYEIINGVLTSMPPAYFDGTQALQELIYILKAELKRVGVPDRIGGEVDIHIDEDRIVRADAVWLTADDRNLQRKAAVRVGKMDLRKARILVPPTLVIESVSPGHERHDEQTKRRWYSEFGVPNYWILDPFSRTLRCLKLIGGEYGLDAEGRGNQQVRPSLFPSLVIELSGLWSDDES